MPPLDRHPPASGPIDVDIDWVHRISGGGTLMTRPPLEPCLSIEGVAPQPDHILLHRYDDIKLALQYGPYRAEIQDQAVWWCTSNPNVSLRQALAEPTNQRCWLGQIVATMYASDGGRVN